jgi:hypothetical protein
MATDSIGTPDDYRIGDDVAFYPPFKHGKPRRHHGKVLYVEDNLVVVDCPAQHGREAGAVAVPRYDLQWAK